MFPLSTTLSPVATAHLILALVTTVACGFSGIAAMARLKAIRPGMARVGVPESWLVFPIGTLKTAGAVGVLLGVLVFAPIGIAAAGGLVLFFVCAVYTHIRAHDYSVQFGLAATFLALSGATLALGIVGR